MLEYIIVSCERVSKSSTHISICEEKIISFANGIENIQLKHWLSDSPFGLLEMPATDIINFLLVYEAINFSFWGNPKWTVINGDCSLDGSMALLYSLLKYCKKKNTTDFSNISKCEFSIILNGLSEIPLFEERYKIIKNVSRIVKEKMGGDFYHYIQSVTDDVKLFDIIVSSFPNFKDERSYLGNPVYFYKLAQLLTSDILHVRELKEKIVVDYSHLIGCADYKIPQVLRGLGILLYDAKISNIVDNKIEIFENSNYEVEIRANVLVVIERIKTLLNNKFCAIDINDYLFLQKDNKDIILQPYHLVRNTNY